MKFVKRVIWTVMWNIKRLVLLILGKKWKRWNRIMSKTEKAVSAIFLSCKTWCFLHLSCADMHPISFELLPVMGISTSAEAPRHE